MLPNTSIPGTSFWTIKARAAVAKLCDLMTRARKPASRAARASSTWSEMRR